MKQCMCIDVRPHMCVCVYVCARVRARVRACMHVHEEIEGVKMLTHFGGLCCVGFINPIPYWC
jgi:hypothetical protein